MVELVAVEKCFVDNEDEGGTVWICIRWRPRHDWYILSRFVSLIIWIHVCSTWSIIINNPIFPQTACVSIRITLVKSLGDGRRRWNLQVCYWTWHISCRMNCWDPNRVVVSWWPASLKVSRANLAITPSHDWSNLNLIWYRCNWWWRGRNLCRWWNGG